MTKKQINRLYAKVFTEVMRIAACMLIVIGIFVYILFIY